MRTWILAAALAVLLLGPLAATANHGATDITIARFAFLNTGVKVNPGSTVRVQNLDFTGHTITSGNPATGSHDGAWPTVVLPASTLQNIREATFAAPSTPGVYLYYCEVHTVEGEVPTVPVPNSYMTGVLVVA